MTLRSMLFKTFRLFVLILYRIKYKKQDFSPKGLTDFTKKNNQAYRTVAQQKKIKTNKKQKHLKAKNGGHERDLWKIVLGRRGSAHQRITRVAWHSLAPSASPGNTYKLLL